MATKATFVLDEDSVRKLNLAAQRTHKPKSQIIREAISLFHENTGKVSEEEVRRRVAIYDAYIAQPPSRPDSDIDDELRELREIRRLPGRLHPVD